MSRQRRPRCRELGARRGARARASPLSGAGVLQGPQGSPRGKLAVICSFKTGRRRHPLGAVRAIGTPCTAGDRRLYVRADSPQTLAGLLAPRRGDAVMLGAFLLSAILLAGFGNGPWWAWVVGGAALAV